MIIARSGGTPRTRTYGAIGVRRKRVLSYGRVVAFKDFICPETGLPCPWPEVCVPLQGQGLADKEQ